MSGKVIKDNKCFGGEFALVDMTIETNGIAEFAKMAPYPTGFTKDNCIIVSAHRERQDNPILKEYNKAFLEGDNVYNTIETSLNAAAVQVKCKTVSTAGRVNWNVKILLYRFA